MKHPTQGQVVCTCPYSLSSPLLLVATTVITATAPTVTNIITITIIAIRIRDLGSCLQLPLAGSDPQALFPLCNMRSTGYQQ